MRNDVHQPLNFDPASYRFVQVFYQYHPAPDGSAADRANGIAEMLVETFGDEPERTPDMPELIKQTMFDGYLYGTCNHCGAAFNYGAIFYHVPSRQYVRIGWECASKRFSLTDRQAWLMKRIKDQVSQKRERAKKEVKAREFVAANCPDLSPVFDPEAKDQPHPILVDMAKRLCNYGQLSEKQILFARKLVRESVQRKQEQGQRTPVVTGDGVTIEGVVLSVKEQANKWAGGNRYPGIQFRMLVQDKRGFRVWGTVPSILGTSITGSVVRFVANVEVSKNDPTYGFFNRPRKAELVQESVTA